MYAKYIKRPLDFVLALIALIILSPLLLVLIAIGAVMMQGNPFFTQVRPGKNEKLFRMIKFRTMTNKKDEYGNLLPDDKRLNKYGKMLRSTSLDELPELVNIIGGDMSFIGPRPLLVRYLPLYNAKQKQRHNVTPGLTGLAQISGRNSLSWEDRFDIDIMYISHITFRGDLKIFIGTLMKVIKRDGISSVNNATMEEFTGTKNDNYEIIKK